MENVVDHAMMVAVMQDGRRGGMTTMAAAFVASQVRSDFREVESAVEQIGLHAGPARKREGFRCAGCTSAFRWSCQHRGK